MSRLNPLFVSMVFLLSGCSSTIDKLNKDDEYQKVSVHDKRIVVPKDLNRGSIYNRYPVPKIKGEGCSRCSLAVPPK